MPLLERDLSLQVRHFLEFRGWRAIRMQRTVVPGQFQTSEPGCPDFEFVHYYQQPAGAAAVLWVEMKSLRPGSKRSEQQKKWQAREAARGAVVVTVFDFIQFEAWYRDTFAWLHAKTGQQELELTAEEKW